MAFMTRKGTRVLHPRAAQTAISYEILRGADEYVTYARFSHRDFQAEAPDHLLVYDVGEPDHPVLAGLAHVLNLVTGAVGIVPWDAMAHSIKPYDPTLGRI
jgi:hypothetical protein